MESTLFCKTNCVIPSYLGQYGSSSLHLCLIEGTWNRQPVRFKLHYSHIYTLILVKTFTYFFKEATLFMTRISDLKGILLLFLSV